MRNGHVQESGRDQVTSLDQSGLPGISAERRASTLVRRARPIGRHRYHFKLYALDGPLKLGSDTTRTELLGAIEGHVVAEAVLMGTYQKHGS